MPAIVGAIFDLHNVNGTRTASIDRIEHSGECIGVMVF